MTKKTEEALDILERMVAVQWEVFGRTNDALERKYGLNFIRDLNKVADALLDLAEEVLDKK